MSSSPEICLQPGEGCLDSGTMHLSLPLLQEPVADDTKNKNIKDCFPFLKGWPTLVQLEL